MEPLTVPAYTLLDSDTVTAFSGATLYRIQYADGARGGYLQSTANLDPGSNAQVYGNAWVSGNAQVSGDAQVYGNAQVSAPEHCFTAGPLGSRAATLTVCRDSALGVSYTTGCFSGSREAFLTAVESTHSNTPHGNAYTVAVMLADHIVPPYAGE